MANPSEKEQGFRFDYNPPTINLGRNAADALGKELDRNDVGNALVICGKNVGSNRDTINPVKSGLGDRLAGIFDETTPRKRISTAIDAAHEINELNADGIVSLGGGSSLDISKAASIISSRRDTSNVIEEFTKTRTISTGDKELKKLFVVPTTMAGADVSNLAGITHETETGEILHGGVFHHEVMPVAVFYDAEVFKSTPSKPLWGSFMNGFNKGIEGIYSRNASPITDATASHGLGLMKRGVISWAGMDEPRTGDVLDALRGLVLVQYGVSREDGSMLSLLHCFGHALTGMYDVQQGVAHAIVTPEALRYLFDVVDARRDVIADALGVDDSEDSADGVIRVVSDMRESLNLPGSLHSIDGFSEDDIPEIASRVSRDSLISNAPSGFEADTDEIIDAVGAMV